MSDPQATVAICTYNGAARIAQVLKALAAQTRPAADWETIVIDNASSDGTGAVAAELMARLLPGSGRVIREDAAGLTFARQRAAREARGSILCFLDDDNIPAPDFVANAIRTFSTRPNAAAIGGKVRAEWERPPSPLALEVQDFALAICDRGDQAFCYERNVGPVGAGLCIRTAVLGKIYGGEAAAAEVIGHKGKACGAGDDIAIGVLAWQLGYECWYEPSLVITHQLPSSRMNKDYLLRLYESIGRGQAAVRRLHDWRARNPVLRPLIGAKDFGRWVKGRMAGPPRAAAQTETARDLHDLNQRLLWGRAMQALGAS
jgi:glycosyltransferase involved in cell wall biosynthesis